MGHIAHLKKKSSNQLTHGNIITLIKRRKKPSLFLWELNVSWFEQTWISFTQGCFLPSLDETGQVHGSGETDFLNFANVFSLCHNYLPFEKDGALHLNKLKFPSSKYELCQVWLKLAQWFWRGKVYTNANNDDNDNNKNYNNNDWQWTNFDQKSSLEPLALFTT